VPAGFGLPPRGALPPRKRGQIHRKRRSRSFR
jgi:hypothetical protein